MENIKIAEVCGLCAGCKRAIDTSIKELKSGNRVLIFKEIVHNKNVNEFLEAMGATCEDKIENLSKDAVIIIRAHGEPPETYEYFKDNGFDFRDCTCPNVTAIHSQVKEYSEKGYKIIIIGKHQKTLHPEVLGTLGWANNQAVLIETPEDIGVLKNFKNDRFYLVCQTTFNMKKAEDLISEIEYVLKINNCELVANKSLCSAQKFINESSARLAEESEIMIVVGGSNSSNSLELFKNVSSICPSIFIEDIFAYKKALEEKGLEISTETRIGITAGASTRKEELFELKDLIIKDLQSS